MRLQHLEQLLAPRSIQNILMNEYLKEEMSLSLSETMLRRK